MTKVNALDNPSVNFWGSCNTSLTFYLKNEAGQSCQSDSTKTDQDRELERRERKRVFTRRILLDSKKNLQGTELGEQAKGLERKYLPLVQKTHLYPHRRLLCRMTLLCGLLLFCGSANIIAS